MSEKPPIIDADFEVVRGPDKRPVDIDQLADEIRAAGVTADDIHRAFADAGHPDFLPGGRYYRRPKMPLRKKVGIIGCAAILLLGTWDIATDGATSSNLGLWLKERFPIHGTPKWVQVFNWATAKARGEPYQPPSK